MKLADWRIGYRLGLGFSFLIFMVLAIGAIAVINLSDFNKKIDSIVSDTYPVTVEGNTLISTINDALLIYEQLFIFNTPEELDAGFTAIQGYISKIGPLLKGLQEVANDSESQRIIEDITKVRGEFLTTSQKFMKMIKANDRDGAINEYLTVTRYVQARYKSKVAEFVDYQNSKMIKARDSVTQSYNNVLIFLASSILLSIILGAAIAWLITRSVTRPLKEALDVAENVAQGDLTTQVRTFHRDETGQLLASLHKMNTNLKQIVTQVRGGAEAITTAATQIAAGNQDLSSRTEEQASSLEETAASMEQLTSTIRNTTDNTFQATELSAGASLTVEKSGEMMTAVKREMREISDSSQRMSDIINVIDSIAFQTNILALNAAVEAARAGEQGRGFAVVASEVRSLAQRSATSAKEIKELIAAAAQKIQNGMTLVESTSTTMTSLVSDVQSVNNIIGEIAQASREQSDGVNQINIAVGQIDTTTQQNAALVEQSATAARSMQDQAYSLMQMVSVFKLDATTTWRDNATKALPPAGNDADSHKQKTGEMQEGWASF
ncbi:MCP four helix bundle domain-containing protein [Brenneria goodwinii]|uniref:methyl-accepting chemotaxis protein n=1 Tax=Brenneria goodwinii TaxID=1109412 RepID=UPI000EF243E4|nr:methyl-accepting chemotaxis protein [Brenneria goodwinii]MCG8158254.1 MCP four helix bundle domain-containing protein [Brenneria goodwinii]MCG8162342.1 MCP four helix bundle domain-containing protein [Brenneria goodwinii]MCG8167304.1 MCP four helix bundle domain-containing protein [Brenneria goodwinii]MCG8172028.1 MCP four helix bundle domain-containing protein [Brenneria goodwinii]MCG8175565.1 MCP four helix bundle domain-containing protein [Brenneria goodwinii]